MITEILKRRSVRSFQEKKVEKEKVETLLKAAMQAPSAGNQQPWEFLVVEDSLRLKQLSKMSPFAKAIAKAPLAILFLANKKKMRFPENWEQDMGACVQNLLLEAVELNLGTVWLGIAPLVEREEFIKELFALSKDYKPYCIVPVGYPNKAEANKFIDRYDASRIHYEKIESKSSID